MSLQYPPHISLTGGFTLDDKLLLELQTDLVETFKYGMVTDVTDTMIELSPRIHQITFKWPELSMLLANLKPKYPMIPWVLNGYHLTLVYGQVSHETMRKTIRMIPSLNVDKEWGDFGICLWSSLILPDQSRQWTPLQKFDLMKW
jgi:hypothetical protein